jgi:hypothetical protein
MEDQRSSASAAFGTTLAMAPARGTMPSRPHRTGRRSAVLGVVVGLLVAFAAPVAAGTNQIRGVGVYDTTGACPPPPAGFEDYVSVPPVAMAGSLEGCWYTHVLTSKDNGVPSGVYQERGEEVFVGTLDGGPVGTFETTYKFSSKWDPDVSTGREVHGRCQHPIIEGSGTGAFEGVTGRVDFKDEVETGRFPYRGHLGLD